MKTFLLLLCVLALAGCGENRGQRTARLYGSDAYRIAGDTTPWSNAPWNGNEHAWELQVGNRARMLNEYTRTR
jgi:hypothetical protein